MEFFLVVPAAFAVRNLQEVLCVVLEALKRLESSGWQSLLAHHLVESEVIR